MPPPDAERAYFHSLLALREPSIPNPAIERALALLIDLIGASAGYIELEAEDPTSRFTTSAGDAPSTLCRGAIGRASGGSRTLVVSSARSDLRFCDLGSVRAHHIDALLCAPIVTSAATGVLYAHRVDRVGGFTPEDLELFELLAREVRFVADRLVLGEIPALREATRRLHEQLVVDALLRTGWNVARAARALGVTRTFVYAVARSVGARRGA